MMKSRLHLLFPLLVSLIWLTACPSCNKGKERQTTILRIQEILLFIEITSLSKRKVDNRKTCWIASRRSESVLQACHPVLIEGEDWVF